MKTEYGKLKKCEFVIGIEEFYTERIALAFPIGNPWIERFNERYASTSFCLTCCSCNQNNHRNIPGDDSGFNAGNGIIMYDDGQEMTF